MHISRNVKQKYFFKKKWCKPNEICKRDARSEVTKRGDKKLIKVKKLLNLLYDSKYY